MNGLTFPVKCVYCGGSKYHDTLAEFEACAAKRIAMDVEDYQRDHADDEYLAWLLQIEGDVANGK